MNRNKVKLYPLAIMMLIISMNAYGFFSRIAHEYDTLTTAVATDFADNLLKLVIVTVFFLFAQAQYIRMEETEQLHRELAAAEINAHLEREVPTDSAETAADLTAKAAKKKKNQRKSKVSAPKTKRKSSK